MRITPSGNLVFPDGHGLYVIPQLERCGVRIEVGLQAEIGLFIFPDIVVHQCDGNNERHVAGPILLDDLEDLLLFIR